ncbi:MAG: peptidoglycan D,D-transpeptidase FtsI family protein [Planctomycetota bacterium]|jgi:penicillin-binding protein 2
MASRAWLLALCFSLTTAVFIGRLVQLQIIRGDSFADSVTRSRTDVHHPPARRGRILDVNGTVITDNRAAYDLAVVLADLEPAARQRQRTPFISLDRHALEAITAELAARSAASGSTTAAILHQHLLNYPAIGRRQIKASGHVDCGLLAIAKSTFSDGAAELGPAIESGLLDDDPRTCLASELSQALDESVWIASEAHYRQRISNLASAWQVPSDLLHDVIDPFVPTITIPWPEASSAADAWRTLDSAGRSRLLDAVSRFVGLARTRVDGDIDLALAATPERNEDPTWLFAPRHQADLLFSLLPDDVTVHHLDLDGGPSARSDVWLIQGDQPGTNGLYAEWCRRVASALDIDREEVALCLARHGETTSVSRLERTHRMRMVVLDPDILDHLCVGLSSVLRSLGQEADVFRVERYLTKARHRADRDWKGATKFDPIAIVHDIRQADAVHLAGSGTAGAPAGARFERYGNTAPALPGIRVTSRLGRHYGEASHRTTGHLVGWLGKLSAGTNRSTALRLGLDPEGWTGTSGLEARYDELLQGVVGRHVTLKTASGPIVLEDRQPIPGRDLPLTLDLELQNIADQALRTWIDLGSKLGSLSATNRAKAEAALAVNHGRAGLVVMDVHSGAIRAMCSTPGFDLRRVRNDYQDWLDPELHPAKPLHDNATWAAMRPGSTIKPLVALVALHQGAIEPHGTIYTQGFIPVAGKKLMRDHPPSPRTWDIASAIEKSSNSFFSRLASRIERSETDTSLPRASATTLSSWYRRFGLERKVGLDIPGERPSPLLTPASVIKLRPNEAHWNPYDTWSMAIGQNFNASPLQVATLTAAIANGGTILKPHLWADAPRAQTVAESIAFDPAHLAVVRRGMELVTASGGTASKLHLESGIKVAAKTGTSEWGSVASRADGRTPDNAWLMGYAPADRPQVAFCIYIYAAGVGGGSACTAVAKEVLDAWFRKQAASP